LRDSGIQGQIPHLNLSYVKQIEILLPQIDVQNKITEILSAHDVTILSLQAEEASMSEVKRGLMQKSLSGKVPGITL
jgi:restriction endonuclease S subunit